MSDRLIYFNLRALGELPRLLCAAADLDHVSERINPDDWPGDLKSKCPYGQLPVVVVDDKWYAQRFALSLYFARKGGLYPTSGSPVDFLKVDSLLMFVEEIWQELIRAYADKNYRNKPETLPKVVDEILPPKLARLNEILEENGTGYFSGDKLSIIDVNAFDSLEHLVELRGISYLDPYPEVKANFERLREQEGIKKYIASRPPPLEGFDY